MGKFYSISLGPILYKTRFEHFLDKNKDVLDNFVWVVDNYELYEPHKDLIKIIDIDATRADHPWSNKYEILFNEKDPILFLKNYQSFCTHNKNFYPLDLQRLAFLEFYKENTLNFNYIGTNIQITNNKNNIEEYFNKIQPGTFIAPYFDIEPRKYFQADYIKDDLQKLYPNLIIPNTNYYFDGWGYGFHFRNKEELILFYQIWEDALKIYHTSKANKTLGTSAGYSNYESIIGWVMNIFVKNFGYKFDNIHKYWDSHKTGMHLSLVHDTWHYGSIRVGWTDFGFVLDDNIQTISDFISRNQEPLKAFYNRYTDKLDYKILPNNVELKYKF
jgi:hypothetical protein